MPQVSYGGIAEALGPFEGLGIVIAFAIAFIVLWEAAIVLSVLLATLTSPRRQRGSEQQR